MKAGGSCGMVTGCLVMALAIAGAIVVSYIAKRNEAQGAIITNISDNFQTRGIIDIVRANLICPGGYDELFKNKFEGTLEACHCRHANNSTFYWSAARTVNNKSHNHNRNRHRCHSNCSLVTVSPMILKKYRGVLLCAKRSEFNYDGYRSAKSVSMCPSGTRSCGKDQTNFLCQKNAYPCPVNYMKLSHGVPQIENIPGAKVIELVNGYNLVYSNENVEGQIIVETDWVFKHKCLDPNKVLIDEWEGLSLFRFYSKLAKECPDVGGEQLDTRWSTMDQYRFDYLLAENSSYFYNLGKGDKLDPIYLNRSIQLQKRGYLHFKKNCKWDLHGSTHDNIQMLNQSNLSDKNNGSALLIASIALFIVLSVAGLVYFCVSMQSNKLPNAAIGCYCFVLILLIIITSLLCAYMNGAKGNYKLDLNDFNGECVDPLTSKQIDYLKDSNNSATKKTIIALILSTIGLLLVLGACCTGCKCSGSSRYFSNYGDTDHAMNTHDNNNSYNKPSKDHDRHDSVSSNDERNDFNNQGNNNQGFGQEPNLFNNQGNNQPLNDYDAFRGGHNN